ncbi:hypothetical protein FEM33_16525 [Dyadobacter flavalbus]|uniref:Uncharacterized protein n=1 Tax=Dyadobacter flavalbus TaxID=2579942 RepID=A0A5M8QW56_9BACT|nr:hypothetical protein [Dyadobacter flavalbus]KAA6438302.1 hypothetical protein FEM33_16525 [Dyadobacter flavalbus]
MEKNNHLLKNALAKLPDYTPDESCWDSLSRNLDELPLKTALKKLPEYEPDEMLWEMIGSKPAVKKNLNIRQYAAAVILIAGMAGVWLLGKDNEKQIAFSQEKQDKRLQATAEQITDQEYQKLKAYCETETLICTSKDYRQLQHEYEKLAGAAAELQEAIGAYNTEPELVRQFATIEQQKAEVLNKMAEMI